MLNELELLGIIPLSWKEQPIFFTAGNSDDLSFISQSIKLRGNIWCDIFDSPDTIVLPHNIDSNLNLPHGQNLICCFVHHSYLSLRKRNNNCFKGTV